MGDDSHPCTENAGSNRVLGREFAVDSNTAQGTMQSVDFGSFEISEKDKAAYSIDGGNYVLGPLSKAQCGVPRGVIRKDRLRDSRVYPGVAHDHWLYVPQQYEADKAACLMVVLDGERFMESNINMPIVMDNLIHRNQLPVIIGLFINAGDRGPGYPIYGGSDNRSIEYDSTNADYATFLIEDVLTGLERSYNISKDPECRGIVGASSGGNGAFTVAWERPDMFRKVISLIGSFVNIRGGNKFPSLIRRSEKKPIRVFLQDGSRDLDVVFGSWPIANQDMAAALAYRAYDYRFELGEGGHSVGHGASILPDAMHWLWR